MLNGHQVKICVERTLSHDSFPDKKASMSMNQFNKSRAAFITSKLWNSGDTINIAFMEDGRNVRRTSVESIKMEGLPYDPLQDTLDKLSPIDAVKTIVNERYKLFLNLNFNFIEDLSNSDIRISFQPTGAWSNIGTDCKHIPKNQATMNFGWLDVATVLHEFGHALGMIHEHQNPRGEPIQWNIPEVEAWASQPPNNWDKTKTDHNIIDKYDVTITNGSNFDPDSIMLYYFPAYLTLNNRGTKANQRLSIQDVIYLSHQYPGEMTPQEFYEKVYKIKIDDNLIKKIGDNIKQVSLELNDSLLKK